MYRFNEAVLYLQYYKTCCVKKNNKESNRHCLVITMLIRLENKI